MIPVAGGVVLELMQQYCVLVVRFLALAVRMAPLPTRVQQIIIRRILTEPFQTGLDFSVERAKQAGELEMVQYASMQLQEESITQASSSFAGQEH